MRRIRLIPALLVFLLSACSENIIQQWPDEVTGGEGIVRIALDTDMNNMTKASENGPDLDEFRVAIYAGDTKMRLYNDSYANAKNAQIKLNSKEHRLVAQHGDSLGCGFDKPYYLADKTFMVVKGENTVEAVAKLANVKIAVECDASINYSDYKVIVKHNAYDKALTFTKSETRYGYMPGGEFTLEIWAFIDGKWKVYSTVPGTYSPNDFVTFTITTDASEGSMTVKITVDSTVEDKNETIEIPSYTVPQEAPTITLAGFDDTGNIHEFIEGVAEGNNATATFVARGAIKSCILDINSEYLRTKGLPSEVDFTNLQSDQKAQLKAAGFIWDENMKDSRTYSWIDFSGVIQNMYRDIKSSTQDAVVAGFNLKVTDAVNKEATSSFSIVSGAVKTTLDVKDYNVWAKKIVEPVVTINKGNVSLVKLQYSLDQRNWSDFNVTPSQNAYALTYDMVPVSSGSTYYLRAIYNGNTACVSSVVPVTTESEVQLGNSGFEDWNTRNWDFNHNGNLAGQSSPMNYYKPWASSESDIWWDSNTTNSLRPSLTIGYTFFKTFPLVHYSTDAHSGTKSAQLTVVNVGNENSTWATTGNWYVGELFLGKGNDGSNGSWAKTADGHSFASRPASLTFWYEYVSYTASHTFSAEVAVLAADGTVIGTGKVTPGSQGSWQTVTVPVTYNVTNKKAASIRVSFKASTASDFDCKTEGEYLEIAGSKKDGDAYRIKLNATLRIDDVTLNY